MNDVDALIAQARQQGFTVERRGSGHWLFRPSNRTDPLVVTASTLSDHRAAANMRSQLRRAGLRLDTRTTS